jgi:hypothetical protein
LDDLVLVVLEGVETEMFLQLGKQGGGRFGFFFDSFATNGLGFSGGSFFCFGCCHAQKFSSSLVI